MILINCLGIQDSGGITVLDKLLSEINKSHFDYLIVCNQNENIEKLVNEYGSVGSFQFLLTPSKGFLYRLYLENIVFRKIIKEKNIKLVYNFSGSAEFFSEVPQMTKVHNLLFYSKKIDKVYFQKKQFRLWFKQIFLKRVVFHSMLRQVDYIEVQSNHVKEYMGDFIDISQKQFFIKSDIEVKEELFQKPKKYDLSKKLRFLYIVGPHFEYLHKNFEDFVNAMSFLQKDEFDFQIYITLRKEQLHNLTVWNSDLDNKTFFLGYVEKSELFEQFKDNTILISTSVIETLGLHVIEAVQNGIVAIVPNEEYAKNVYGSDIVTYKLLHAMSLVETIKNLTLLSPNEIEDKIIKNQNYLLENEKSKIQNIEEMFNIVLKDNNV